jgi:hypothetical protein
LRAAEVFGGPEAAFVLLPVLPEADIGQ